MGPSIDPYWGQYAAQCEPTMGRLVGPSMGPLWGPVWAHYGPPYEAHNGASSPWPIWAHVGLILGPVGPICAHVGSMWDAYWAHYGPISWPIWAHIGTQSWLHPRVPRQANKQEKNMYIYMYIYIYIYIYLFIVR
jgi:hypothetical protein